MGNADDPTLDLRGRDTAAGSRSGEERSYSSVGRYQVERVLGSGSFGQVLLARDDDLGRLVAIKIPRRDRLADARQITDYLAEARTVAGLDHSGIVPVFDVGRADDGLPYVVSKYIEGSDLAATLRQSRPSPRRAAELVAALADALQHAHSQGLVHRDIKPGNILLDGQGQAYLCDFGLALREEQFGRGPTFAGTPAYMSPEQARGEGHLVDGRSDIFSLGVVFYELLTGKRPFRADNTPDLLRLIGAADVRPPRQFDASIPRELERICLKALARRITERYTAAADLAEELRLFLAQSESTTSAPPSPPGSPPASAPAPRIVPKGLRSFDAKDGDYFLELLPGVRDRHGLPTSVSFWKERLEEPDVDQTFRVGLIYGPSGCGKSSLVKAGLLPQLDHQVRPVYVEASADETEARLLTGLRKAAPDLPAGLTLAEAVAHLRQTAVAPSSRRIVLVIDQFEQWLHGRSEYADAELTHALRQCDGVHVQALVMVRDDFWMAVSRLFRELDIPLLEGRNSAAVDLFDLLHARKVLAEFGRAYGRLPDQLGELSDEQQRFLGDVVDGLATDGKVIPVRLALFAEMVKGRPWTPATLRQLGGISGVGVAFLEETFSVPSAPAAHRHHQVAVRALLQDLLPGEGTDIKGHWRSRGRLLEVSGLSGRERDFADLLRILDSDLRLITPTATDPQLEEGGAAPPEASGYQLTHDYLVPALREWLTRKQRETRRGRAELKLEERSAAWHARPEDRRLPSLREYLDIALLVPRRRRSASQQQLMRRAGRVLTVRWGSVLLMLLAFGLGLHSWMSRLRQRTLDERIETAVAALGNSRGPVLPLAIDALLDFPHDTVGKRLREELSGADGTRGERLAWTCALARLGEVERGTLVEAIAGAPAAECDNLATALRLDREPALADLRRGATDAQAEQDWRLKTRLAVIALHLGDERLMADMLAIDDRPDPVRRTQCIEVATNWLGDPRDFAETLRETDSGPLRSGVALMLGGLDEPLPETIEVWGPILDDWYRDQPDSGTHSASQWALRRWGRTPSTIAAADSPADRRDWVVRPLGQTLLRIPTGRLVREVESGPAANPRTEQQVVAVSEFWIADREVTIAEFERFAQDAGAPEGKGGAWPGSDRRIGPSGEHPVQMVSWHDAVGYCNWLSRREGLRPCYARKEGGEWQWDEEADGYRLPTESQWEYACRAGTTSAFSFGDDESLLDRYGVYFAGQSAPVGSRLCNAWGLFDMHGNVWEWCHDWHGPYGREASLTDPHGPSQGTLRIVRGGSWSYYGQRSRSANRGFREPEMRDYSLGFRVALPAAVPAGADLNTVHPKSSPH